MPGGCKFNSMFASTTDLTAEVYPSRAFKQGEIVCDVASRAGWQTREQVHIGELDADIALKTSRAWMVVHRHIVQFEQ